MLFARWQMARADCPRCGSDLVVAVLPESPSEWVEELRGGNVRTPVTGHGGVHWLCRSCALRWDQDANPDRSPSEPDAPPPGLDDVLADLGVDLEPRQDLAPFDAIEEHSGALLRRAREERGHTLAQAASGTMIPERHLRALESDASLEDLPATPYARFFLREYADFLQLQPEPLLRDFEARHPVADEPPLQPLPEPRDRRRVVAVTMALAAVAALVVIALLLQPSRPPAAEPVDVREGAVEVHDSGRVPPTSSATPERRGIRAVLSVSKPCWVGVVADGEVLASATLVPGERVVYRARRDLQLTLGNAGGVKLRVNDESVATGDPGDVVVLELSWHKGELLIAGG
jgi:cytoskeletal protein RodZ